MLLRNYIFFIALLLPTLAFSQRTNNNFDTTTAATAQDINKLRLEDNWLVIKDTIFSEKDTVVIRKFLRINIRDSLEIHKDSMQVMRHSIIYANGKISTSHDTTLLSQDTILSKEQIMMDKIKEFSERHNFISRLVRHMFIFDEKASVLSIAPDQHSDQKYDAYDGKIIRKIDVKVLDVSGYSLVDPDKRPHGFAKKSLNTLHIKSHKWLIRNRLLFKEGDVLEPLKISETERLFRGDSYIYDARVIIQDTVAKDSVDVLVLVQDVWSISASVKSSGLEKNRITLKDVNFLGLGQVLDARINFNPNFPAGYNYYGVYTINNIYKTFITGQLYYTFEGLDKRYGLALNREFISPAIKWAGGVNMGINNIWYLLQDAKANTLYKSQYTYWRGDFWLGYGANISHDDSKYKGSRLIFSGRYIPTRYTDPPVLPDSIVNIFHSSDFYLASIGIVRRRYYKDKYVFRLGRTEDIPEGDLISFTAGLEEKQNRTRPYMGIDAGGSRYLGLGYIFLRLGVGGFYDNSKWKEGVFFTHFLYFTPLVKVNRWKSRYFFGARYVKGISVLGGSVIRINNEQGIRGFSNNEIKGTSKFIINSEMDIIPPLNLLGFRMAMILYADFAWIGDEDKFVDRNNLFSAFGLGFRIKNDHLIFNAIQLYFGYYPHNPSIGSKEFQLFKKNGSFFNYYDLNFSRPSVLPFQ